ncbi:MAG TPA: methyltransferase domain-containing protein [Stellaceae bacterium]|nr:methyltransferase domain-containing protein [Stellaceae bacterium]
MARPDNPETSFQVFDPRAVRSHRERAASGGRQAEFLFAEGAKRLAERLGDVNRRFARALDLGSRGGTLGRELRGRGAAAWLVSSDSAAGFLRGLAGPKVAAEPETLPFAPASFDLVVSNLALHWVNDLPGALLQLRQALQPDGLLLASLFAGETLSELRESLLLAESEIENGASPRVSPFADARELAGLLQRAGFALPVVDTDRIEATYSDALSLMRDLQAMGESNAVAARRHGFTRRATLLRAAELYQARYAGPDGRVVARFEIATLTAWAPDQSQPKPLRPGSAAARLADALGAEEKSAGEAAGPATPPRKPDR